MIQAGEMILRRKTKGRRRRKRPAPC